MTQFQTHLRFHGGKPSDQIAIKSNKKCGLLSVHKTVLDGQWTHDGWLVMGKIHYEHFVLRGRVLPGSFFLCANTFAKFKKLVPFSRHWSQTGARPFFLRNLNYVCLEILVHMYYAIFSSHNLSNIKLIKKLAWPWFIRFPYGMNHVLKPYALW